MEKMFNEVDIWSLKLMVYFGVVITMVAFPIFYFSYGSFMGLFPIPLVVIVWLVVIMGNKIIGDIE